jgi:hypothetical protein
MIDPLAVIKVIVWLRRAINILPLFKAENPKELELQYHSRLLNKVKERYKPLEYLGAPGPNEGKLWREKLQAWAQWYEYRADMLWGRPSPRDRFRSAWLYATAAELYKSAKNLDSAAMSFHYAAHEFRELGSLSQSYKFYMISAELTLDENFKSRNYNRALGLALSMGDEQLMSDIRRKLPKDSNQSP